MKEKILEAFRELGFQMEDVGKGYSFYYEGLYMQYLYNEDEEEFLSIGFPCITGGGNMMQRCILLEKINSTQKYIKALVLDNNIWLIYDRELIGEEDLTMIIAHMILHLKAGVDFARNAIAEIE